MNLMDKVKQRIALAKVCGIIVCPGCFHQIDPDQCSCGDAIDHIPDGHSPVPCGCTCGWVDAPARKLELPDCPDYLGDRDAMQEAVRLSKDKISWPDGRKAYLNYLADAAGFSYCEADTKEENDLSRACHIAHAEASHHAEALLRVLNLWEEA